MAVAAQVTPGTMEKWIKGTMPSVSRLAAKAAALVVEDEKGYAYAAECLKEARGQVAFIEAERVKITKPINEGLRNANALFKHPAKIAAETFSVVNEKMLDYRRREQARAAAEQRRLDEEAAKEQAKLQKRADVKADRAEASGDLEKAQAIRDAVPEVVAAVAEAPKIPEIAGQHLRKVWKIEITNMTALLSSVLAKKVPAEAVLVNESFIKQQAQDARDRNDELTWPGVRVYFDEVPVTQGKIFSDGRYPA